MSDPASERFVDLRESRIDDFIDAIAAALSDTRGGEADA